VRQVTIGPADIGAVELERPKNHHHAPAAAASTTTTTASAISRRA